MKRHLGLLAMAMAATLTLRAQPIANTEPINGFAGPNGPLELWFPNVFDPAHPKLLTFQGQAWWTGPLTASPESLKLTFDYTDLAGQNVYLPGWDFLPPGPGSPIVIDVSALLPFCPPQVSIHFETRDGFGYEISGTFTHECIPEPVHYGLMAGLGLLGLVGYRRSRRLRGNA
jgi:hypothetical protein